MADISNGKLDVLFPQIYNFELCIILCNTPDSKSANDIAHSLLTNKLAACVSLLPNSTSIYCWQDEIKKKTEVQLFIKSRLLLQQEIFIHIKSYHPYQTPEILVLPIIGGDSNYLSWINNYLV